MKRLAICAVAAFLFGACAPTIEKENFCTEYAQAVCEVDVKCCTAQTLDEAACNTKIKEFCDKGFIKAIDAGKSTYDPGAAATCVSDLRAVGDTCDANALGDSDENSCADAIAGAIPEGGDCSEFAFSCAKGLVCHLKFENNTTTGTCETSAKLDEDCSERFCDDGLYCDSANKCKTAAAIGQTCGGNDNIQCVSDAYCDNGTCAARKAGGEACTQANECKSYGCTDGKCDPDDAGGFCSVGDTQ